MKIGKSDCCQRPTREWWAGHTVCTRCEHSCNKDWFYTKEEILTMRLLDLYDLPEDGTDEDIRIHLEKIAKQDQLEKLIEDIWKNMCNISLIYPNWWIWTITSNFMEEWKHESLYQAFLLFQKDIWNT